MEETQTQDNDLNAEFGLSDSAKSYLLETAKWAKFLAIVGFVMIGILVIFALFFSSIMSSMPEFEEIPGLAGLGGTFVTIIYLLMALLYFFPALYLYRFATKTKVALVAASSEGLSVGLGNLKSTFKFMGILMFIVLVLYGILFVFVIFATIAGLAS